MVVDGLHRQLVGYMHAAMSSIQHDDAGLRCAQCMPHPQDSPDVQLVCSLFVHICVVCCLFMLYNCICPANDSLALHA